MRNKIFAVNLLLSFSSLFAVDKTYKILSTEIQTTINRDGTIDFTESREYSDITKISCGVVKALSLEALTIDLLSLLTNS